MKRSHLLFIGVAVAQLVLLAWTIFGQERILKHGEVFLFKTAPVDPRDPFRGEYVRLDFEAERGRWVFTDTTSPGVSHFYGRLAVGADGYARISHLRTTPPPDGPYLKVEAMSWSWPEINSVSLPFDRYYLQEGEGPRTEALLAPQWNDDVPADPLPAHAVVRVLNGRAVVEDLVVGGKPLHQWLD